LKVGILYIWMLKNHYFKAIKDEKVKTALIVASYNLGPTAVFKIFSKKNSKGAIYKINKLSYSKLIRILYAKSPKETKRYMYKVLKLYKHI